MMEHWCHCQCHAPTDAERDEHSRFYGVSMYDDVALHAALSCCRAAHWKVFYLATEPEPLAPKKKTPWLDGQSSQADGWKDT